MIINCWFCNKELKEKEGRQKCKYCNRETRIYKQEIGEWITCDKCGEGEIWSGIGTYELLGEPADFNIYLDRPIPEIKTREEGFKLRINNNFVSCVCYGINHPILKGEIGTHLDKVIVISPPFNIKEYKEILNKEWQKRDKKKKYLIKEKDLKGGKDEAKRFSQEGY